MTAVLLPDLQPGSPDWQTRMTASKVAAVLGLSPWESRFSLWHRMSGLISNLQLIRRVSVQDRPRNAGRSPHSYGASGTIPTSIRVARTHSAVSALRGSSED